MAVKKLDDDIPQVAFDSKSMLSLRELFGRRLIRLRLNTFGTYRRQNGVVIRRPWSTGDVAKALCVTQPIVSMWERGKALPSIPKLLALCTLYDVEPNYLLGWNDDERET